MATQLAKLGVDVIEAGFPAASPEDFAAVQRIAREVRGPVIAGLARAVAADIDQCWEAIKDAEKPRIHTFLSPSDIHLEAPSLLRRTQAISKARIAKPLHSLAKVISWLIVWSMSAAWVLTSDTGTRASAWRTISRTELTYRSGSPDVRSAYTI